MTFSGVTAVVGAVLFLALLGSMGTTGRTVCVRVQGWPAVLLILTCAVAVVAAALTVAAQLGDPAFRPLPPPME